MAPATLAQALRNAIEAERASMHFYLQLADSTDDEGAQAFLADMAKQEKAHAQALEEMATRLEIEEMPNRADDNVELIETAPAWAQVEGVSLRDALEVALEAENQATLYYEALADSANEPVASFFRSIAATEAEHALRLGEMLEQG